MTIAGNFIFDKTSGGRDANGFRTLRVTGDVTVQDGGLLQLRQGDRLGFDSTAAARLLDVNNGGLLDAQGQVIETTISTFVDADADTDCAAAGTVGRKYTITPASGIGYAKKGGRIVFQSGKALNRHLEIRLVTATTFSVCTDTADATSGSDTTGGQRLTPHANRNFFCTGAGAPVACCSGAGAGTCPTRPVSHHTEPNAWNAQATECTAAQTPYPCCTGAGTGYCTAITPAVGDKIAIVYDAHFFQSAGSNGYRINGDLGSGNDPMPIFQAVNITNAGTPSAGTSSGIEFLGRTAATIAPDIRYVNFHDFKGPVDGWRYRAVKNQLIEWSAFHDLTTVTGQATQGDTNALVGISSQFAGIPVSGLTVRNNVFYRGRGVHLHPNEGGTVTSTGIIVKRNLFFEGCVNDNAECFYVQIDNAPGAAAIENVFFDLYNMRGQASGPMISLDGAGSYAAFNWGTNLAGALVGGTDGDGAATHNYISHNKSNGLQGGRMYSNLVRNVGLDATTYVRSCLSNPKALYGNFCLGAEDSVVASADCTGGDECANGGVRFANESDNNDKTPVVGSDNFFVSFGQGGDNGVCVVLDGIDWTGGGGNDADQPITLSHTTCDGHGRNTRGFWFANANAATSATATFTDFVCLHTNGVSCAHCTGGANVIETFGTGWSKLTAVAAENGGASTGAACTTEPTLVRRPAIGYVDRLTDSANYTLSARGEALTAGLSPASSPIGARVFRFNRAYFTTIWPALTFDGYQPQDVSSVSNTDSDKDGVPDLFDNCKRAYNPSQYDSNNNGVGNACGG